MSASIHKFSSQAQRNASEQNKLLIKQIASCLNEELSELIGRMFDGADDLLFQLAENADSNEDQSQYFDAMRMLRIERSNITQNFAANLKSYLKPSNKNRSSADVFNEDELSLVDQDEMEEMVAVSAMHSKAMNLYGDAVHHLEARIEFLSMKATSIFDKDALAPKNICESFKDALSGIELSTNNKLVLYKLFDQEVILNLETLYQNLNQLFIDQGILPQIKLHNPSDQNKVQQTQPAPENAPQDAMYIENPSFDPQQAGTYNNIRHSSLSAGSTSTSNLQNDINNVVNQFIHGDLTASGPGIPASFTASNNSSSTSGTQFYDRRDVLKALSNLQTNVARSTTPVEEVNVADFKRALLADMSSRHGGAVTKQVNQVDEKTIDFIEMLFDAIVEDQSISEPVTNLLLRLQIPVIKIAMLDESFFSNGDHPCRTTLNMVAHLGRGISSKEDELFIALDLAIENLLTDFDIDITSFEQAAQHLENIESAELAKASEVEKNTQKTILQAHAREVVLAELQFHLKNRQLPRQAQKLILKNLSTLMFHHYIKHGKNSDEWKQTMLSTLQLIELLQPVESSQAFHRLSTEKDSTLNTISDALMSTKQNPAEIELQINNTHLYLDEILSFSSFNPDNMDTDETYFISVNESAIDNMSEPEIDFDVDIHVNPMQEQAQLARQKIAMLPAEVRPGVWFEVYNGEDKAIRRAKLSVIIMEEARLIFVDRVGVKVLEKDADEFRKEIEDQKSQIISDHSAFDHALGLVINSLSGVRDTPN